MRKTNLEEFIEMWESYIPTMNGEELRRILADTSPHHPNENMAWLYDRILMELANKKCNTP